MKCSEPEGPPDLHVVLDPRTPSRSLYRLVESTGGEVEPLNAFLDATALRGLSDRTLRTYAYALLSVWKWMRKVSMSIGELTEIHLADYIRHLRDVSAEARIPPAPRSINLRLVVLRALYRFHTNRDLPRAAKAPQLPIPVFVQSFRVGTCSSRRMGRPSLHVKVPQRLVVPLTHQEVHRFFESLRTYRDLAIAALMLFCGLRSREVLSLRKSDVNLLQEEIRVSGKGDKDRVLPLAPYVRRAIASYLDLERPATVHDVLFVKLKGRDRRGNPMTHWSLRAVFRFHRARSGVKKANPHRLRHTFAVDMVREGVSLPVLKRLMGHANIEMTMRYVNLSAEDVREEFERAIRRLTQGSPDGKSLARNP